MQGIYGALLQLSEVSGAGESDLRRDDSQGDLRDGAVESSAERDAAVVGYSYERSTGNVCGVWRRGEGFNVGPVDPKMAGADSLGCASANGCGWAVGLRYQNARFPIFHSSVHG